MRPILSVRPRLPRRLRSGFVADDGVLPVLHRVATEIRRSLDGLEDWGLAGTREGQYRSDLVADGVALAIFEEAGFGVLSEESGVHHPERPITVVIDPVDGSTNASRGLPWWATSLCAIDADGPLAAVVVNQATGTTFEAYRGDGARRDGRTIAPSATTSLAESILASNGWPSRYLGWMQFRCLGAAALDLCAVADGTLDAFIDCGPTSLAPWDYLGAALICAESGAAVAEAWGRDLVVVEYGPRRTIVAAASPELLAEAVAARTTIAPGPG
jgi:myo-inositol-1(or 4)-monophosphatase